MSAIALNPDDDRAVSSSSSAAIDGGMQLWAGLSYGSASFVNYLVLSGVVHLPNPGMIGMVWMAATAAFVLFGVVLKVGTDRAVLKDVGFRRFRAAWGSLILGAAFLVGGMIIMMLKFGQGLNIPFITAPIAMVVYGIGWRLAAVMSGRKWPNILSLGSFLGAIYLATLAGTPQQSLVYTLCLIVFAVIPGLALLLRRTPA